MKISLPLLFLLLIFSHCSKKSVEKAIFFGAAMFLLLFGCKSKNGIREEHIDIVKLSEEFQSWEETEKPEGSSAYLGLGAYTKCLCTAVFVSGRTAEDFAENSSSLILSEDYVKQVKYDIDKENNEVTAAIGDSIQRVASFLGDQGCVLDIAKGLHFEPQSVTSKLAPAEEMEWPMGDKGGINKAAYDQNLLKKAGDLAFKPEAVTAAFLVVHKGKIILERYREDLNKDSQLESWSMGKSLTATLIGRLIHQGKLSLHQRAPIKEWQKAGDPRLSISIQNLMQMSSGLRFPSYGRTQDSTVAGSGSYDGNLPLAQLTHIYPYTGSTNVFEFAVKRPLEFIPGRKGSGQYRNCDPLALGYIFRNIVEANGRNYWTWPQEELFDKIGIRKQLLETDRYGNFILTGYDFGTARNWARLAMLYMQDGVWEGERLLPEGFVDFVSTPAESWEDPIYGGLFWINTNEAYALPKDTYAMKGGGGQNTIIVPSMDLVVVRLGHSKGADHATASLNEALEVLVKAL